VLRFDPFRDLDRLSEQLLGVPAGSARSPRFMPMDLYRSTDRYVLEADLPGVDPGSVDIDVDNGTLTIRAERSPRTEESVQWIASERFTGSYMRQLALGDGVDASGISANYANGVLTVTIPVAEKAKPRRIQVESSTDRQVIAGSSQQAQDQSAKT
jgi:HSP20 family protein